MEGWRAHCAVQMVQGLRRGRSGEGPEMDGLIMIGSLDTDPCSWVPSSTLDPQFTANGEISCDLSFSHVSFCLKKNKNPSAADVSRSDSYFCLLAQVRG